MIVFAHRGASGHAPENTLAAMKKAIELGAKAIELDIHNVEGELYVFHDRRLDNKSSGSGLIEDVSRQYISSINVGGEPIPTLWDVMSFLCQHDCMINIELKGMKSLAPFIDIYPKLIQELNIPPNNLLISSFHHGFLTQFRAQFPLARIAPLFEGIPLDAIETANKLMAFSLHLSISFFNLALINQIKTKGIKVFIYTVDNPEDIVQLKKMGVDGIFTNYPDRALKIIEEQ